MDYRTLTIFTTLAETLHFRQTSTLYNMTPSTLSRIIQRLEDELNCTLFIRNNTGVTITKQGEEFYHFAKDSINRFTILQNNIHPNNPLYLKGTITVECTVTIAYGVLPQLIKTFSAQYPNISINIATGSPNRSMQRLLNNNTDFIIQPFYANPPSETQHKVISRSKMVLVCPLNKKIPLSIKELETLPIIVSKYPALTKIIENLFKEHGITPLIHSYIDGNEAMLSMIAAGLGYAILPKIVIENSHLQTSVSVVENILDFPTVEAAIFMKQQKYIPPIKQAFWKFIEEQINI